MRLVVKQKDSTVNELRFTKGPIYIGRHANSQVFLPDRAVSRQHAVLFKTQDGKWVVEDMDSASKTFLNGQAIHKAEIKTGDVLKIVSFTLEVDLDDSIDDEKPINLEDTLVLGTREPQVIVRKADAEHAPAMRIPAKRTKDFAEAARAIGQAGNLDDLLVTLLETVRKQFSALRVWCAMRRDPTGPMTSHIGKSRRGITVDYKDIELSDKIKRAIENSDFLLLPRIPADTTKEKLGSVMIAPIVGPAGCFGVVYVDNDAAHERYTVSDLDYLMLLAVHAAAVVEKL